MCWPSEEELPGWRNTMEDYYSRMLSLGRDLMRAVAFGLELGPPDFFDPYFPLDRSTPTMSTLRLNYYPEPSAQSEPSYVCPPFLQTCPQITFLLSLPLPLPVSSFLETSLTVRTHELNLTLSSSSLSLSLSLCELVCLCI